MNLSRMPYDDRITPEEMREYFPQSPSACQSKADFYVRLPNPLIETRVEIRMEGKGVRKRCKTIHGPSRCSLKGLENRAVRYVRGRS